MSAEVPFYSLSQIHQNEIQFPLLGNRCMNIGCITFCLARFWTNEAIYEKRFACYLLSVSIICGHMVENARGFLFQTHAVSAYKCTISAPLPWDFAHILEFVCDTTAPLDPFGALNRVVWKQRPLIKIVKIRLYRFGWMNWPLCPREICCSLRCLMSTRTALQEMTNGVFSL